MTHPSAELLRRGYDAFAEVDLEAVHGLLAEDITWRTPAIGRGSHVRQRLTVTRSRGFGRLAMTKPRAGGHGR
ncbi:MAG: hypothetical protein ACTHQQ_20820 [Solirubrobacteraceae bacterium]